MEPQSTEFDYQPLPQPSRITNQEWPANTRPLLSIVCATYNHVDFIRDCIEGFLKQETTFPVEILIHDDASTDGTADIVWAYQRKHPRLIKAVFQEENQYSRGVKVLRTFIRPLVQGKYIASCEGDDYWVDPRKLEIQVAFLERNLEYVISGHDAVRIDRHGTVTKSSLLPAKDKRDHAGEDLMVGNVLILTMSRVSRADASRKHVPEAACVLSGDRFSAAILGSFGAYKYHPEIKPAVYRSHPGGIWSEISARSKLEAKINTYFWISRYFTRVGKVKMAKIWEKRFFVYGARVIPISLLLREILIRVTFARQLTRWFRRRFRY